MAPARSLGPVVASFFAGCFTHTKGPAAGKPFQLEPWQQADMDLVMEVDRQGRRLVRELTWGIPRGNGKSPLAAGIGLFELVSRHDSPDVFVGAGSRQQARIIQGFADTFAEGGLLRDHLVVQKQAITSPGNAGVMRTVSADGDLQHGLSISTALVDEWHVWKTRKQTELYWAFATATQKREDSLLGAITTAGESRWTLCGERYMDALTWPNVERLDVLHPGDGCLLVCRNPQAGQLLIWRGAPDDADITNPAVWRACNPASWIPTVELEKMARRIPERVFRRLILNQWADTSDVAVTADRWDACTDLSVEVPVGGRVWVGVSMSEQGDTASVCLVGEPQPDERRPVEFRLVEAPPGMRQCHHDVAEVIRTLAERHQIVALVYNPFQFGRTALGLQDEGVPLWRGPKASKPGFSERDEFMCPASEQLLDAIERRVLAHDGDLAVRREILSARSRVVRTSWRIVKPPRDDHEEATPERAEAALALVMAWQAAAAPQPVIFGGAW